MGRNTVAMVVCVAAVVAAAVDMGWCWAEESYAESVANKANEARQGSKEAIQDAKVNADSWAEWAAEKVAGYDYFLRRCAYAIVVKIIVVSLANPVKNTRATTHNFKIHKTV